MMSARLLSSFTKNSISPKYVLTPNVRFLGHNRRHCYSSHTNNKGKDAVWNDSGSTLLFAGAAVITAATTYSAIKPTPIVQKRTHQNNLNYNQQEMINSSAPTSPSNHPFLLTNFLRFVDANTFLNATATLCEPSPMEGINRYNKDSELESLKRDNSYYPPSSYYYLKMEEPTRFSESHAIFGPLKKKDQIERLNVYRLIVEDELNDEKCDKTKKKEIAVADIRIGKNLNGHTGIVHGGIMSLLFDDTFGWAYEAMRRSVGGSFMGDDFPIVVTANLNVNFRKPLPAESDVVIRVYHEKSEGRKIYLSSRMESHDGSVLYAEATALFIKLKNTSI
jgi:acyl-coenzyme A thioesterase PaaI-like protein